MTISLDKTYRTRDGLEARVFMTDNPGRFPVMGAVRFSDGHWMASDWTKDGHYTRIECRDHPFDLIEVKPQKTGWLNIYADDLRPTKDAANAVAGIRRIACIQITFAEGEGL